MGSEARHLFLDVFHIEISDKSTHKLFLVCGGELDHTKFLLCFLIISHVRLNEKMIYLLYYQGKRPSINLSNDVMNDLFLLETLNT